MTRELPPIRAITSGPKHHWFGYYDKLQFDPTCRYVLGMSVDFNGRSPRPDDVIKVGMIDIDNGDKWIELGESRAWCWQQGCMLQWRPGSGREVVWNDREGDRFVCHILDVETREKRTIPFSTYALSPNGMTAITTDFRRLNHVRPGYGYAGVPDPNRDVDVPDDSGIWRVDLETGKHELIISIADVLEIPYSRGDFSNNMHYFNHLLFNTDGTRFVFLHRWVVDGGGRKTRMMTCSADGSDIRVLDDFGETSHFIWRDARHILAWANRPSNGRQFYLYEEGNENVEVIGEGVMMQDGHCTYLRGNEWILNDTYPDEDGKQRLYLYHVPAGNVVPLGDFLAPEEFHGEWRCDLHARSSPDGKMVTIDSAHDGTRQIYHIGISALVL
jgi:hypothetical protein